MMHIFNETFNAEQSVVVTPVNFPSLELATPSVLQSIAGFFINYTLTVYIDPKVQPLLPKQDLTKHPKIHKTSQTDIIATISKLPNIPSDILSLPW